MHPEFSRKLRTIDAPPLQHGSPGGAPLRRLWYCRIFFVALVLLAEPSLTAAEPPTARSSDARALACLFGEDTLQQSAAEVSLRAREMPPAQRLTYLARWVLPGEGHDFRLRGVFRRSDADPERAAVATSPTPQRLQEYPEFRWLVSPALDLVETARQLGRLEVLQHQVESEPQLDANGAHDRLAFLLLIAIARGNTEDVEAGFPEMFSWQRDSQGPNAAVQRWPDLLVLWSAAASPVTSHLVTEDLFTVFPLLQYYNEDVELDLVNDYLRVLKGRCRDPRLRSQDLRPGNDPADSEPLFESFSRVDAATHGRARPLARFYVGPNGAHKITGHEMDYLVYRSPVHDEFEVACEVATQAGAFTELSYQGLATKPINGGERLQIGGFAKATRQIEISPPIEGLESPTHYRAVSRGGRGTYFINGREVLDVALYGSSAPWLALRSWRRTASEVLNIQLWGAGSAPRTIDLLNDPSLGGWASYFHSDSDDGMGNWKAVVGKDQTIQLVGGKSSSPPGSFDEGLLRYERPITWDATLHYEFFWQSGEISVHPAFGRCVFLVTPVAVRLHQLTDGRYEQTDLRPDNVAELAASQETVQARPDLREGWNRADLQVTDDVLVISINGKPIAHHEIHEDNSRIFGLFHYRDQVQAVVRNARLTGDWPRNVPPIERQPLASAVVDSLNASAKALPAQFRHHFSDGVPPAKFDFNGDPTTLALLSNGIRMGRWEGGGVHEMRLCAVIKGDFDVVAGYEDLEISPGAPTWHCGVGLAFNLDNPTRDRCAINRRRDRMKGHHYVAFGQKVTNPDGNVTWVGGSQVVDESTAGKLRLVRRGNTVYSLHAIADSPHYRLVAKTELPPGDVEIQGLRLITDIGKGLRTKVTWTELQIQADQIDFLQASHPADTLARLDAQRRRKVVESIDLKTQSLDRTGILSRPGERSTIHSDENGVTVTVNSETSSERCYLIKPLDLGRNFDVQVDFDVPRIDRAMQMGIASEVALQVRLDPSVGFEANDEQVQVFEASMILRHKANGKLDLVSRVVARGRGDKPVYLPIRTVPVKMPDQYRIVQHARTLYFLYSEAGSSTVDVIASYPLAQDLDASALFLSNIASPGKRTVETRWKQLLLYGTAAE